jgi:hypothetical protein
MGWPLIALVPGEKTPHRLLLRDLYGDSRWSPFKVAPALAVEVDYWFEVDPLINLGVIPCAAAGLVIADIDHLDLLDPDLVTPTASSGREEGGKHLYFASEQEVPMQRLSWGDVNPSYVVLPGSTHRSGLVYEWLPGLSPEEVPLMAFEEAAETLGVNLR